MYINDFTVEICAYLRDVLSLLQTHRRSRALKKMNRTLLARSIRKEIVVSYFLPLTTSFLLDETYTKAQGLQESAIDSIGILCKHLPWHVYINQLKYFLSLLSKKFERKKLLVRQEFFSCTSKRKEKKYLSQETIY